jgi:hypothetical protein
MYRREALLFDAPVAKAGSENVAAGPGWLDAGSDMKVGSYGRPVGANEDEIIGAPPMTAAADDGGAVATVVGVANALIVGPAGGGRV